MAAPIVVAFNPSMPLHSGWPYTSAGGSGNLGNDGAAASRSVEQPASKEATKASTARANHPAGSSGRLA